MKREGSSRGINLNSSLPNHQQTEKQLTFKHLKKRGFVNLVPRGQNAGRRSSASKESALVNATHQNNHDTRLTSVNTGLLDTNTFSEPTTTMQDRLPSRGGNRNRKPRVNNAFDLNSGPAADQSTNKDSSIKLRSETGDDYALPPMPNSEMGQTHKRNRSTRLNKKRSANINQAQAHSLYRGPAAARPRPVTSQNTKASRRTQENPYKNTMAQDAFQTHEMSGKRSQIFHGIVEKTIEDEQQQVVSPVPAEHLAKR